MPSNTVHLLTVVWHTVWTVGSASSQVSTVSATALHSPKNNSGRDVMLDAPSVIDQKQLDELNLIVEVKE